MSSRPSPAAATPLIAPWSRRLTALFVDWFVALLTVSAVTRQPLFGDGGANPWYPLVAFFVEVTLLTGLLGYSFGKRLTGVRVVDPRGEAVGLARAAVRTALVCLVFPVLLVNADRRGLHDIAAGSIVTPAH